MNQHDADVEIDGERPSSVVAPRTAQEAADLLAEAAAQGQAIAPVGGGTALGLGNVPKRLDLALSTRYLTGIIDYEPTDMTLSVWAGSRFGDVQAALAERGQTLPIDAPRPDAATIGGLLATATAGPRRSGTVTFRDLIIGISSAHPSGTVTKAGGMVVKNVSGFDLMRLNLGSLGTLGLIVSANFKVLPLPRAESTPIASYETVDDAMAAAERIRASRVRPAALEVFSQDGVWKVATRIEGREGTVRLLTGEAVALLQADTEQLDGAESAAWWQRYTDQQEPVAAEDEVLLRGNVRPKGTGGFLSALRNLIERYGAQPRLVAASPAIGQVIARVGFAEGDEREARFLAFHRELLDAADHVVVLAAPPAWKRSIDVWGTEPETIDVMRALKEQFDPASVLNPGRFAGRI
ncbi:MAG TPA: FAD-binding protein [Thermomicrobiales bacterium]|nr:FAD-binding protein [Thermomicrobiales bacterium]